MEKFDFIICGTGCSGLLLAHSLSRSSKLSDKKVLLIDNRVNPCQGNTFGFWHKGENEFDPIVTNKWNNLLIADHSASIPLKLKEYSYRMINGSDLYLTIRNKLNNNPNFVFVQDFLKSIDEYNNVAIVETNKNKYLGDFIFNSTPPDYGKISLHTEYVTLWQHFTGWEITTTELCFDSDTATFMDFRIGQGPNMRFAYVLPISVNKALIEIIAFDNNIEDTSSFDELLKKYISDILKIDNYKINYTESGMIPMTEYPLKNRENKLVFNIGLRGGMVSMATGYGFTRMQREINKMVSNLEKNGNPLVRKSIRGMRFRLYNHTLLDVLFKKRLKGNRLFIKFFSKNNPDKILSFLDDETSLAEELSIFCTVDIPAFVKAIISTLKRAFKRKFIKVFFIKRSDGPIFKSDMLEKNEALEFPTAKAIT